MSLRLRKQGTNSSPKEVIIKFMKTTSIRGLPRIVNSKNKIWRMVHIVFFLAALTLTTIMILETLKEYFEYKVMTKTDLNRKTDTLYFPDVTLCNNNPHSMNKSFMAAPLCTQPPSLNLESLNTSLSKKQQEITKRPISLHATLSMEQQEILGHKKEDFIRECNLIPWHGEEEVSCQMRDIVLYRDIEKLNCYTFQLKAQERYMEQMKDFRGVSFVLFLAPTNQNDIPKKVPSSNGVIVYTHEPNTMPSKFRGFTVSPGFETRVSISVVKSIQLPAPYSDCKMTSENIRSWDSEFVYDQMTCMAKCMQDTVRRTCGCLWEEFPPFGEYDLYCRNTTLPNFENNSKCLENVKTELQTNGKEKCPHCKDKCNQLSYLNSISQSVWPDVSTHLEMYKRYIQNLPSYNQFFTEYEKLLNETDEPKQKKYKKYKKLRANNGIKDRLIKLDVILNSKNILMYEQKEMWTLVSLLTSLASTLIFGIGFTYFAFAEIFECIFYVIKSCFRKEVGDVQTVTDNCDIGLEDVKQS